MNPCSLCAFCLVAQGTVRLDSEAKTPLSPFLEAVGRNADWGAVQ